MCLIIATIYLAAGFTFLLVGYPLIAMIWFLGALLWVAVDVNINRDRP